MRDYPVHTPYSSKSGAFQIGLRSLGNARWIEVDEQLRSFLDEKRKLHTEIPENVFVAQDSTIDAQQEALDYLVSHLLERYPEVYRLKNGIMEVQNTGYAVSLEAAKNTPLLTAAFLVPEDLVIMRKMNDGWNLVAASVSFPSSWSLTEKFSKPMHAIHEPVPGFNEGTRNAMMIERIFDNLPVGQPVERFNWSIYGDAELYHSDRSGEFVKRSLNSADSHPHLRIERQTLHKLPKTGDILFTIRIHVDPIELLANHPDRDMVSKAFMDNISTMNSDQLAYKGIQKDRDALVSKIRTLINNADGPDK